MGDGLLAKRDIDKCREIAHNAQAVHDARSEGCHGREKRRNMSRITALTLADLRKRSDHSQSNLRKERQHLASYLNPLLSIDIAQGRHHLQSGFPRVNCQVHERTTYRKMQIKCQDE
jgi:hypothetical protein